MNLKIYRGRKEFGGFVFRWRITGRNGEIVASGEGYRTRQALVKTLRRLFNASASLLIQLHEIETVRPNKTPKHK